jgi:23S rRNA (adenine2030-N6)-methyltransferase
MRPQDKLFCFELHPEDYKTLTGFSASRSGIVVRREDGPASLKALLPPPSRRGLVLIDPPWEEKNELDVICNSLAEALKRFREGVYLIWYPLLARPKYDEDIGEKITRLASGVLPSGKVCRAELSLSPKRADGHSPRGMYGSGIVIVNPPYGFNEAFNAALPFLAGALGTEPRWKLETI